MQSEAGIRQSIFLRFILVFFLVVEFSLLMHVPVPGARVVSNSLFLLLLIAFFSFYLLKSLRERQFSILLVITVPILIVPFLSAYQAQQVFGQPFIFGFLADRIKFFIISPLLLVYLLETNVLTIKTVERALMSLASAYFFIALFLYLVVDPELFRGTSFVIFSAQKGMRYNINQALVLILLFYSFYKAVDQMSIRHIVLVVLILVYLFVLVKGRSLLVTVFVALMQIFLTRLAWRQRIAFLSFTILAVVLFGTVALFFFQEGVGNFVTLFSSALDVVTGGEGQDPSAKSRVFQAGVAWEGVKNHPLLGNGFLSSQWNGGFSSEFEHFYPSDIGWLGLLYVNGLIGFILLNVPFALSFWYSRKTAPENKDVFLKTMESFMFYLFLHSIFAAFAIKKIGIIVFPFAIIYFYRFYSKKKETKFVV
jgi:hypothetical protein